MPLKRVAAILLAIPMLHLNVARAAIACERHEDDAAMTAAMSHDAHAVVQSLHDEHAMHAPHGADGAAAEHPPGADAPSTECCRALASCSFAFGGADEEPLASSFATLHEPPASAADVPPSRIRTPEPPPPKA